MAYYENGVLINEEMVVPPGESTFIGTGMALLQVIQNLFTESSDDVRLAMITELPNLFLILQTTPYNPLSATSFAWAKDQVSASALPEEVKTAILSAADAWSETVSLA